MDDLERLVRALAKTACHGDSVTWGGAPIDLTQPFERISVRDASPLLGDLSNDFDFSQKPRKPVILPVHPKTDLR